MCDIKKYLSFERQLWEHGVYKIHTIHRFILCIQTANTQLNQANFFHDVKSITFQVIDRERVIPIQFKPILKRGRKGGNQALKFEFLK